MRSVRIFRPGHLTAINDIIVDHAAVEAEGFTWDRLVVGDRLE